MAMTALPCYSSIKVSSLMSFLVILRPQLTHNSHGKWEMINCCSWDGVDCDNRTGRVVGLDLSSSCLFGSINSTRPLFRLVHLTSLDLSYNNFNLSRIPVGVRRLSELKHLNLSFSNFSGQIPSEVLQLSNLVSLDLTNNSYLILQKPSLKDLAETLTNLTELELSGVNISSHVPQSLSNLTSLTSLLLRDCSLQGHFPPAIFQILNLRFLSLRYNPDLTGYLPEFQVGRPLEMLRLDGTNFSGQLPHSIGNLKSLSYFTVSRCGLEGLIPSSIGNLTRLKVLELYDNYFSGKLPISTGNLTQLNVLDLSENYFSGNIPSSSLDNLLQLTFLSLYFNNFSPGTLHWIGKLTNLQTLELLETNSYGVIPSSFRNLTKLTVLWLGSNYVTGEIPSWVGNLTQLTQLDVSDNELQGPIPESVFGLPNLQDLFLDSNNLNGSLKFESFLQMKQLSHLQLSGFIQQFFDRF